MPDIVHLFPVNAPIEQVFSAVSSPAGLNAWWTLRAAGRPEVGAAYQFWFGEGVDWRGVVRAVAPERLIEWEITVADADWTGTRVGFVLEPKDETTVARFHHRGWATENDHFQTSSFCWALYLRLLRRYVETGEVIPYAGRYGA
jgi:uncharacterized protein YndB with AHSA1/START domain